MLTAGVAAALQMQELERLVAAKRAQLSVLTSEHEALSDKARGLEQLVAAAGAWRRTAQASRQLSTVLPG